MKHTSQLPHFNPIKSCILNSARIVLCTSSTILIFICMFHRHLNMHMFTQSTQYQIKPKCYQWNSLLPSELELLGSFGSPWKWWWRPSLREVDYPIQQPQSQPHHWKQFLQTQVQPMVQQSLEEANICQIFLLPSMNWKANNTRKQTGL